MSSAFYGLITAVLVAIIGGFFALQAAKINARALRDSQKRNEPEPIDHPAHEAEELRELRRQINSRLREIDPPKPRRRTRP